MTQVMRSCSPSNTCLSQTNAFVQGLPYGINANVICNQCNTDNCNNQRTFSNVGNKISYYSQMFLILPIIISLYFFR